MATVTVLGAGYMGGALAMVAAHREHRVRLWGTWLDDSLIQAVRDGREHPRLGMRMPRAVETFASGELAAALAGADLVVNAVTSEGVLPVMTRAWSDIPPHAPVLSVSKGFLQDRDGRVTRISIVVRAAVSDKVRPALRWVHVGGPSKAVELARGVPTAVFYASHDAEALAFCVETMRTDYYWITPSRDLAGVETCSALKNAYATASGLCDGLILAGHAAEMYNVKSALLTQAVREMAWLVPAMGGDPRTAYDLPGAGDLHVTAVAGRNRRFGELVGRGIPPAEVVEQMAAQDELTEGYPAIRTAWRLVQQLAAEGPVQADRFPLLQALHAIVYEDARASTILEALGRGMTMDPAK